MQRSRTRDSFRRSNKYFKTEWNSYASFRIWTLGWCKILTATRVSKVHQQRASVNSPSNLNFPRPRDVWIFSRLPSYASVRASLKMRCESGEIKPQGDCSLPTVIQIFPFAIKIVCQEAHNTCFKRFTHEERSGVQAHHLRHLLSAFQVNRRWL